MIYQPKFKAYFKVELLEPDKVLLMSEKGHHFLTGRIYYLLATLLNGHNTISNINNELKGQASLAEIYYALKTLENKGYIVESNINLPSQKEAFWNFLNLKPEIAEHLLLSTKSVNKISRFNRSRTIY